MCIKPFAMSDITKDEIQSALQGSDIDKFHYTSELGIGSFGKVCLVKHILSGGFYAIKVLKSRSDEERKKYQDREIELLRKFETSNCNVIRYFDCWKRTVDNRTLVCIQMELCWLNLKEFLIRIRHSAIENGRLYRVVFPQILNGLRAIHDLGWVHRDINLDNILVAIPRPKTVEETRIKIGDFGIARKIGPANTNYTDQTKLDDITQNPGNKFFSAPEMSKTSYDQKVDLFSAGIVLYLISHPLANPKQWLKEVAELRPDIHAKIEPLREKDELLFKLLQDLLKEEPQDRPSAHEAFQRFSDLKMPRPEDANATPKASLQFLLRSDSMKTYEWLQSEGRSFDALSQTIESWTGIKKENQIIKQEIVSEDSKTFGVDITNDDHVELMEEVADKSGFNVRLVLSTKEAPESITEEDLMEQFSEQTRITL